MMYARGRYAKASCDRCGGMYRYGTLKPEYKRGKATGSMVCAECWDGEHPSDNPRKVRGDAQALRNARPRKEIAALNDSPHANNAFQPPGGQTYEEWLETRP